MKCNLCGHPESIHNREMQGCSKRGCYCPRYSPTLEQHLYKLNEIINDNRINTMMDIQDYCAKYKKTLKGIDYNIERNCIVLPKSICKKLKLKKSR